MFAKTADLFSAKTSNVSSRLGRYAYEPQTIATDLIPSRKDSIRLEHALAAVWLATLHRRPTKTPNNVI